MLHVLRTFVFSSSNSFLSVAVSLTSTETTDLMHHGFNSPLISRPDSVAENSGLVVHTEILPKVEFPEGKTVCRSLVYYRHDVLARHMTGESVVE